MAKPKSKGFFIMCYRSQVSSVPYLNVIPPRLVHEPFWSIGMCHLIIESAAYIKPIKMLILNCFQFLRSGWSFALYIASYGQQKLLCTEVEFISMLICYVQCILDCLPVSVSTDPVYSDDQFAHSYSNLYKLYNNDPNILLC